MYKCVVSANVHKRVLDRQVLSITLFVKQQLEISYLGEPWLAVIVVHVDQVRFCPEWPKARILECDPPVMEEGKVGIVIPRMQLQL